VSCTCLILIQTTRAFPGRGLACQAREAGDRVVLITATRGEAGRAGDPPICGPDELLAVRERELREAAAIIGVHDLHLVGYRDRALADVDREEIRGRLVALLRHHRPEIVISFDPNTVNRHPDHVAISRFVSDAIAAVAHPAGCPGRVRHTRFSACCGCRCSWRPPPRGYGSTITPVPISSSTLAAK
jgi:LmbE family N-acetylglucosaminyl deacetylase